MGYPNGINQITAPWNEREGYACEDCGKSLEDYAQYCDDCKGKNEIQDHVRGIFQTEPEFEKMEDSWFAVLPNKVTIWLTNCEKKMEVALSPEHISDDWNWQPATKTNILKAATGLWKG